jgi:hypothetical protein
MSPLALAISDHCELLCFLHLNKNFCTNLKLVLELFCMLYHNVFRIEFQSYLRQESFKSILLVVYQHAHIINFLAKTRVRSWRHIL